MKGATETTAWLTPQWFENSTRWFRSYGKGSWAFNEQGLMQHPIASINDLPIAELDRKVH